MTLRGLADWALAFALTHAIEVPIYVLVVAPRLWRALFVAAFGMPAPTTGWRICWAIGFIGLAEGWAVTAEAWWLRRSGCARWWRWSLAADAASATTGLVVDAVARR